MHQILIVEDEPEIRRVLRVLLQTESYRLIEADTLHRAEIEARSHKPDLLLVDLGLPDGDGLTLIRRIRTFSPVAIIVISARTMEEQKIAALDAGADDYVMKPFSAPELLARVRAALRRNSRGSGEHALTLQIGRWLVDLERREIRAASARSPGAPSSGSEDAHLTPLEYRVLESLARQAGLIVTQTQLIREVWGPERLGDTRSLRVCIKNLRAKLERDPKRPTHLVTEAGVGYRLRVNESGE
ncbi:MAG TPA: response regulator [Steroidobacteraceae bacterium]|jgi:two-component system KDP operon response regulator KdpE